VTNLKLIIPPLFFIFLFLLHRWCNSLSLLLSLFVWSNTSSVDLIIVHSCFLFHFIVASFRNTYQDDAKSLSSSLIVSSFFINLYHYWHSSFIDFFCLKEIELF
jgi:hypothetical protein